MLKKTIKYKDLDGNQTEVDAYFNLTKAEALELNIRNDLEVIGRSKNSNEIMDTFHRLLQMSYGVKTGDGRFIKVNSQGAPLYYEFKSTEAYSELFLELFSDADYALEFIRGILPADIVLDQEAQGNQSSVPAHLANHPSMQGHKQAQPQSRREAREEQTIGAEAGWDKPTPTTPGPEYEEFLRWRDSPDNPANQTLPERVSSPEEPQQPTAPRDELL